MASSRQSGGEWSQTGCAGAEQVAPRMRLQPPLRSFRTSKIFLSGFVPDAVLYVFAQPTMHVQRLGSLDVSAAALSRLQADSRRSEPSLVLVKRSKHETCPPVDTLLAPAQLMLSVSGFERGSRRAFEVIQMSREVFEGH